MLGQVLTNVPIKTYDERVAVLDLDARGVPQARALQAVMAGAAGPRRRPRRRRPRAADRAAAAAIAAFPCTARILQAINGVSLAALLFLLASGFTLSASD